MGQHALLEKSAKSWETWAISSHVPNMPVSCEIDDATLAEIARRAALLVEMPTRPSKYVTPDEAAEFLRCDRRRVYELRSSGRLRGCKENGRLLFKRTDVEGLIEEDAR